MLNVPILENTLVRIDIGRPDDVLPVIWRVPPQCALWIGLNSMRKAFGGYFQCSDKIVWDNKKTAVDEMKR